MHESGERRRATAEQRRLDDAEAGRAHWQRWGTYLSERAWGTVREDYSADGDAWNYFPYDAARSRAYRWNEDGLAGWCDSRQILCFGLGLWNGVDRHLKERPFGLTNEQGNHGEDVKEYWFYTDNTPTHSYASMVYKYPQVAFPYDDLVATNAQRSTAEPEYELFDALADDWLANRYFDIQVEYAKVDPEDLCVRITATNRAAEAAELHLLWQAWYRNTWSWEEDSEAPFIGLAKGGVSTEHPELGRRWLYAKADNDGTPIDVHWLFCENETNNQALFGTQNASLYCKDGINDAVVDGRHERANDGSGSKAAAVARATVAAGAEFTMWVRFSPVELDEPFTHVPETLDTRRAEADEFYQSVAPAGLDADQSLVQRQALAGLLWCKQFYNYHVTRWLQGDPTGPPPPPERWRGRNSNWKHIVNEDVLLMPDAWEYPWYASWDMGFHCVTMALIDPRFAKHQLNHMLSSLYQHPHGQLPAYEWNFSDTNPPVLAWAAWQVYILDAEMSGTPDVNFLAKIFRGLISSLTNWLTTEDPAGDDLFAGGFLGMDNIGIFNRDTPLPTGGHLVQSDGTAWVAHMALQMAEMALELSRHSHGYTDMIEKMLLNFAIVSNVLETGRDGVSLWNDDAGFYCDAIVHPDGSATQLGVISLQAVIPMLACAAIPVETGSGPGYARTADTVATRESLGAKALQLRDRVLAHHPEFHGSVALPAQEGAGGAMLFAVVRPERLRRILTHLLNPAEMLSDHGIRSLSAAYRDDPYTFWVGGDARTLPYWPAESGDRMFGGNSNWRGPVWLPINLMVVQSLLAYDSYFGDTFAVEYPTGSGVDVSLAEVANDISTRLVSLFTRGDDGRRPVFGTNDYFQTDPHWRDLVPFYEYFDGDDGHGCGASHQTGWTAAVALLLQFSGERETDPNTPPVPAPPAAAH
ncbi:MAG: glucosidase [Actinobacteria bacterium]|nr:glucosidase [Actinomycetota bacterium]